MACDVGYLIKDHMPALLQALSEVLHETYNMPLITTKCLHTAIMIMYLFLGTEAIQHTLHCDVSNIHKRVLSDPGTQVTSHTIAVSLSKDILLIKPEEHALFYIMITDKIRNDADNTFPFPGHVFVIERTGSGPFNMYQSYINHFDFRSTTERPQGISIGKTKMRKKLQSMVTMMDSAVWTEDTTRFWMDLTGVPETSANIFEGMPIVDNILLCYRKVEVNSCHNGLRNFVDQQIEIISKIPENQMDMVYGTHVDATYEHNEFKPLTSREILGHMIQIKDKID